MKVCIIQPKYSVHYEESDACLKAEFALLDQCDSSMDVIVCPEMCDVPALAKTKEDFEASAAKYHGPMMEKAAETAKSRQTGVVPAVNEFFFNKLTQNLNFAT